MNDTFRAIFAAAPLGSVIAFSDGTPQPPERFKRKLRDWQERNGNGRLMNKSAKKRPEEWDRDSIKLRTGVYGDAERTPVLIVNRIFSDASELTFTVDSYVAAGRFVLLSHSVHVGTEFQGDFATLEEARARQHDGHRYSDCGIYRVGELGALDLAEGLAAPKLEEAAA